VPTIRRRNRVGRQRVGQGARLAVQQVVDGGRVVDRDARRGEDGRFTCPGRPRLAKDVTPAAWLMPVRLRALNSLRKPFSKMLTSLILLASHWFRVTLPL
jgi:hypothetical protein